MTVDVDATDKLERGRPRRCRHRAAALPEPRRTGSAT